VNSLTRNRSADDSAATIGGKCTWVAANLACRVGVQQVESEAMKMFGLLQTSLFLCLSLNFLLSISLRLTTVERSKEKAGSGTLLS
jgi:hypothetical protein